MEQAETGLTVSGGPLHGAAGNLCTGISGGLRCEIVGSIVYDNGLSDNIIYRKAVG